MKGKKDNIEQFLPDFVGRQIINKNNQNCQQKFGQQTIKNGFKTRKKRKNCFLDF